MIHRSQEELVYIQTLTEEQTNLEEIQAKVLQSIYAIIEELPPKSKRIFKAFFFEGKTTAVIAQEFNISPQTALNQKIKVIKSIRLLLMKKSTLSALKLIFFFFFLKKFLNG